MKKLAVSVIALVASGCAGLFGARRGDDGRLPSLARATQKA